MSTKVLLVTKGHGFNYSGFYAMFDENPDLLTTQVEQPAAQVLLRPENVAEYEAVVFYDMWGMRSEQPSDDYRNSIEALIESGTGLVFMNHALVQWPGWPLWREIHGSSFMMREGELNGRTAPRSAFRGGASQPERNGNHFLSVQDPTHPVLKGLGDGFRVEDEIYLRTDFLDDDPTKVPLLRSDYDFSMENFQLPGATPEEQANWKHPRGTNLVAWAKRSGNCPVVATDEGDGPEAYANPQFRQFLANAIHWVASDEAKAWASGS